MAMEPLPNLSEQSARIGTWLLSVATHPRVENYTYSKGAGKGSGQKFECLFVSEDSNAYCLGQFRRKGKEPGATNEFKAELEKFKKSSIWKVNKISLAKSNTKYLGCSHKVVIDMNSSKFQPVLQSTVKMPQQATPPEDLSTLLQCAPGQLVDVIAFVTHVSESRTCTTFQGMRDVVDVTIMDDSGDTNAAKSEFAAWFPALPAGNPCDDLKRLRDMAGSSVPVTFFNLVCQKADDKTILKPSINSFAFEAVSEGTKATRLIAKAEELLATSAENVTVVSELPAFQPRQEVDYLCTQATLTVCRLLDLARQSDAENLGIGVSTAGAAEHTSASGAAESASIVFQINHARVLEPKGSESVFAKETERLWPSVRVIDSTGTIEIRMREKAALDLSKAFDAATFAELAEKGALNFPVLSSIRVTMKRSKDSDLMETCIVEAVEQDLLCPRSLPNSSGNYLANLLHSALPDPSRMIAASMSSVHRASHVGMMVESVPVSCVLSVIAHVGRSETQNLDGGYKLVSKGCWNVPFEVPSAHPDGAPEHADVKIVGEIASYCTMENVQDFTLTTRRPTEPMYALIVISSVRKATEDDSGHIYMVDKVAPVQLADVPAILQVLKRLGMFAKQASQTTVTHRSPAKWEEGRSPASAKKARRLGQHPTADLE